MEDRCMDNPFGKIVDIIVAVILLFIFPLLYFSQRTDTLMQQVVSTKAADFIDTIRTQGYITKNMYENFLGQLDATNNIYDINFKHKKLSLEPEYRFKTPEEIIGEQDSIWNGQNIYHYYPITTELPKIEDPISPIGLNTETNESVLAHAVNGPANPNHVHTNDCNAGHRHGDGTCNYTPTPMTYNRRYYDGGVNTYAYIITCGSCNADLAGATYQSTKTVTKYQYYNVYYTEAATGEAQVDYPARYWSDDANYPEDRYYHPAWDEWNKIYNAYQSMRAGNYNIDLTGVPIKGCYNCGKGNAEYTIHRHKEARAYSTGSGGYRPNDCFSTRPLEYANSSYTLGGVTIRDSYSNYVTYTVWLDGKKILDKQTELRMYYCPDDGFRAFQIGIYYPRVFSIPDIEYMTVDTTRRGGEGRYYTDYDIYLTGEYNAHFADQGFLIPGANGGIGGYHHVHKHCGKTNGQITYKCGLTEDTTPDCSSIIVSISPTHPIQKVYLGEPLITTATATFLDGSTKVIVCSADFIPNTLVANKLVTLSYYGSVNGKQTGSFTYTITVTVIPKTKTCPNRHTYNLAGDGSDPGCPYCAGWLRNLEVIQPDGGEISIYRGTNLIDNGVVLFATYFNGRTDRVYNGYVDNLDKYYVGTQDVTISYKGKNTNLRVIIKRNLKKCDICGKYYELYPDDTDPGCPFCKALIPVFTGNVLKYFSKAYAEEIVKELYEGSGTYYFNVGDYLSIDIMSSNETIGTKLLGSVLKQRKVTGIHAQYGGSIRDETKVSKE